MADTKPAAEQSGTYAIVEASGTQIWLQPNRYYDIDRLQAEVDDTIKLENVLLVKDGEGTTLGQPYVKDATVSPQGDGPSPRTEGDRLQDAPQKENPPQEWSSAGTHPGDG